METRIHEAGGTKVAEVVADGIAIRTAQDALDVMMSASYDGAVGLVVHAGQLAPTFFELRTRLAGDIVQKFVNYGMRLAIVGDFDGVESESLRAFLLEANRGRQLSFVPTLEEAITRIAANA